MKEWVSRPRSAVDWLLIWLAVAYFAVVAIWDFGSSVQSSADALAEGEIWTLLTSALSVEGDLPGLQLLLTAIVAGAVIVREGPRLWWAVALTGHVGSALIAYGIIGIAELLDSASADRVADDADYGVSCVLAASLGALAVSGFLAARGKDGEGIAPAQSVPAGSALAAAAPAGNAPARAGGSALKRAAAWDRVALVAGLIGLVALLPLSFGWYGVEHPIAYLLGAGVAAFAIRRRAAR